MDWPRLARRRMSVAETSLETFSSKIDAGAFADARPPEMAAFRDLSWRSRPRDQVRRNDQPQSFGANSRTIGDDEIAETEKRFVFLPHGNVEKRVGANDEINAVAMAVIGVAEIADGVDGVVKLRTAEIFAGFRERRNEMRMLGASER